MNHKDLGIHRKDLTLSYGLRGRICSKRHGCVCTVPLLNDPLVRPLERTEGIQELEGTYKKHTEGVTSLSACSNVTEVLLSWTVCSYVGIVY